VSTTCLLHVQAGGQARTPAWDDPTDWVIHSYPWPGCYQPAGLFHLRAEDVTQQADELDPANDSLVS